MIRGLVESAGEAIVRLRVRGPTGAEAEVAFLVDSGFNSSLTLPAATVEGVGLFRESSGRAVLADGSVRRFDAYAAEVAWETGWRPVIVYSLGDEPLLGMQILAGHRLRIDVIPGGEVEISPLP